MSKQDTDYGWVGWAVAGFIAFVFIIFLVNNNGENNDVTTTPSTTGKYSQPAEQELNVGVPQEQNNSWSCSDATSYNQNAYDDNKCTNGTETRYVSDSQAVSLDPDYSPGQAGARYYNNQ